MHSDAPSRDHGTVAQKNEHHVAPQCHSSLGGNNAAVSSMSGYNSFCDGVAHPVFSLRSLSRMKTYSPHGSKMVTFVTRLDYVIRRRWASALREELSPLQHRGSKL